MTPGTTNTPTTPPPSQFMTCEMNSTTGDAHAASSVFHHTSVMNGG